MYKFLSQVKQEMGRVSWLSRKELISTLGMVLASVAIVSLLFLFVDFVLHNFVSFILNIGK